MSSNSIFTSPDIKQKVVVVGGLSLLLFVIEIVNTLVGHSLIAFGIHPRELVGLLGIFTSPFLHGNMDHFMSNIGPFAVLSGFIVWRGIDHYIKISLFIMIMTGFMVWLLGPSLTVIVGASGVIFGYLGYLIGRALFEKNANDVVIAVVVMFIYGGMVFGVFPGTPGVSWEAHLFGLLSGIGAAWVWKKEQ